MPDILISEIFGPTIQGEGALAGRLTVFVRTGGCDSRCQWCVAPETNILLANGREKQAHDIAVGDQVWGMARRPGVPETVGQYQIGTVEGVATRRAPLFRVCFEDGRELVAAEGHAITLYQSGRFRAVERLQIGQKVRAFNAVVPWMEDEEYGRGYLAGVAEGDGSLSFKMNKSVSPSGFQLRGGPSVAKRVLREVHPVLQRKVRPYFARQGGREEFAIVSHVEPAGEGEVVSIKTSLGTYVSNGILSRNCDTLYAVLPEYKSDWVKMSAEQIIERIEEYSQGHSILVTVSGGNPALQPLGELLELGQARGHRFALETQGTRAPDWLGQLDFLTISPKPPSSGMKFDGEALRRCIEKGAGRGGKAQVSLKVVVFDEADYEFARAVWREFPDVPFYLSVGTEPVARAGGDDEQITRGIGWLIEKAAHDGWKEAVILPQIHVLLWGQRRGV